MSILWETSDNTFLNFLLRPNYDSDFSFLINCYDHSSFLHSTSMFSFNFRASIGMQLFTVFKRMIFINVHFSIFVVNEPFWNIDVRFRSTFK